MNNKIWFTYYSHFGFMLTFCITIEEDKTGDENNLRQRGQQNLSGAIVGGEEKRQESMWYCLFI